MKQVNKKSTNITYIPPSMHLILPSLTHKDQWIAMTNAFSAEGTTGFWLYGNPEPDFGYFMAKDEMYRSEKISNSNKVPATTYWLIDNDQLIGHTNIRHRLNKSLELKNGNIGYHISPAHRKKGYGTKILELALIEAKRIGLKKVLITCDENNIGSAKIIEKNGGILENIIDIPGEVVRTKRYWIEV
jgi:predicted acetyltransferase